MNPENAFAESELNFDKITKRPEVFLSNEDGNLVNEIKTLVKTGYDFGKSNETKLVRTNTLPELIIERFDLEQIWQQIELQNEEVLTRSLELISNSANDAEEEDINTKENNFEKESTSGESESAKDDADDLNLSDDSLSNDGHDRDNETEEITGKSKPSIVDDEFFKLYEMEKFLNVEEKKLNNENEPGDSADESDEEESEDLFEAHNDEIEDDEESIRQRNPRYKDFFRSSEKEPSKTSRTFLEDDEVCETETAKLKSTLELREERIKTRMKSIEESALSEKPWQLKGEITAQNRPQNSLLEEIVEFDLTSRPAPVITEQTSLQLEDIIHQRIKDRVFDSVQRKKKPVDTPLEYRKKLVLNQEKSKESLAQIYEKEYLQQQEALNPDAADKEEEEPEAHKEIRNMLHSLFTKLDALSNFHFTPRQAAPEMRIVSNLPAINIEEVAPVATSDAALLAPEEIKPKTKGDTIGETERTATDKKRERRKKKLKQKHHADQKRKTEELINRLRPGLGNKYSKDKAKKQLQKVSKGENIERMNEEFCNKGIKSSTAFFKQLQEDVQSHIKNTTNLKKTGKKHNLSAKKMKL